MRSDFTVRRAERSPLCCYEKPCPNQGRAEYGNARDLGACINTPVRCVTCGRTGEVSERKDLA
jgi:hypothetical protein